MTIFLSEADAARLGLSDAKPRRSAKHAREARPEIPRAKRADKGEGDRVPDLMRLAAAGWVRTNYTHETGEHFMSRQDGTRSAVYPSYRAMLDAMLVEVTR